MADNDPANTINSLPVKPMHPPARALARHHPMPSETVKQQLR